jgi:general nucleoside transport system ATP-binding protein
MVEMPAVVMRGIVKRFGQLLANDHVDLEVHRGEILALLGENGAGKTTLMNVLYGLYSRDEGEIFLNGQPVQFRSAHQAIEHGLGMVHQHFMLVPTFTVAENLVLGQPSPRWPRLERPEKVHVRVQHLSERYRLGVRPDALVSQLSVGQQQRVEILKALYRGAQVLILDEPTAVLTPQEVGELLGILRDLARQGHAIIFISHKLHEVMACADQIVVMRDGRIVRSVKPADTTPRDLARMMVGRDVSLRLDKPPVTAGEPLLRIHDLCVLDDRDLPALRGLTLSVRAGEILGIAGVEGNGQAELETAISGVRAIQSGSIQLDDQDITHASLRARAAAGLSCVPSDRYGYGLLKDFTVAENLVLDSFDGPPYTLRGLFQPLAINAHATRLVAEYNIRTPSIDTPAGRLSGGNAQKLLMARALARQPRVLVVAQPTRGLDVGASEYTQRRLLAERARGAAILLISTELEEILNLADRILVLYEGQCMGELAAGEATPETLGMLMAGRHQ